MYLSLPLPSTATTTRTMTVTVFSTDGTTGPCPYTVNVSQSGYTKTLIDALSNACSLRDDERLLVAEVLPFPAYEHIILIAKATI
jgi:ubiquitin carboxyl-terminal hydrolase 4/11/15